MKDNLATEPAAPSVRILRVVVKPLFRLGDVMITPGIRGAFSPAQILPLLARHHKGDWGCLNDEDKQANADALKSGARILSAYMIGEQKVWILTEAETTEGKGDRATTTIMLPEEY